MNFISKLNEKGPAQNQSFANDNSFAFMANTSKFNKENLKTTVPMNTRNLTLKQMKETIEEIYASKQRTDKKNREMHMPRETMEQHMYTYLNQKFGLKSLIIEWAGSLILGIKKYAYEENDIAVFGKILKNECDEEFILVQSQIKNTIIELFKMHLRGKYPFKQNKEIKDILESKTSSKVSEDEFVDIVSYMYNKEDSEALIGKIKSACLSNDKSNINAGMMIGFNEFQKVFIKVF